MWRKSGVQEETVELRPGVSISIHAGTSFQFRNDGAAVCPVLSLGEGFGGLAVAVGCGQRPDESACGSAC